MRLSFILLVTIISTSSLHAQAPTQKDTLCFCNGRAMLNGKKLKYKQEQTLFTSYPASSVEYKKSVNRSGLGGLSLITGVTCGVIALCHINKKDGVFSPYTVTFVGATLLSVPLISSGTKHMKKAVWLYNREE